MPVYPNFMFGQSASWSSTSRQNGTCNQFSRKTSFELPFPSQKIVPPCPWASSAKIVQFPLRAESEGVVIVEVVAKYWLASDLEFIRMNKISRDGDELTANSSIKARVDLFNDEDAGETERPMNTLVTRKLIPGFSIPQIAFPGNL